MNDGGPRAAVLLLVDEVPEPVPFGWRRPHGPVNLGMPGPGSPPQNARMALTLIDPLHNRWLYNRSAVNRKQVIEHLKLVLTGFANRGEYSKFYIGMTGCLEDRLEGHRKKRPDFKLMIPIYSEPVEYMEVDSFDHLEKLAIDTFKAGIVHPDTKKVLMKCDNGPGGASPKNHLYILVG